MVVGQGSPGLGSPRFRLRITYRKRGDLRFLSHLDLARTFERALRRSGLPIGFSEGFNPRIRLSFPGALPTGIESESEELDVTLTSPVDVDATLSRLREVLPPGIDVIDAAPAAGPFRQAEVFPYEIRSGGPNPLAAEALAAIR